MSEIQSNIKVNIDTAQAVANLKNLQARVSDFHTQMARSGAAANRESQNLQQNLINSINATGKFSAGIQNIKTTTESFTTALEKNKLSMGEYFKYSIASTKSFGKTFKTEFDTINKVARERVKDLQTQYIKLGRDANGAMKSIAIRPLMLDMDNLGTKTQIAAQRQQILNQLLKQGSTNLLNFGKNTQWAGRQLMVGFTIPLTMAGAAAAKSYMQIEKSSIAFKRVYGDVNTTAKEANKAAMQVQQLAASYTKYGVAVADTMDMAAKAAAMGKTGSDLLAQIDQATKLSVLGGVDQNTALDTTISLTNAFGISTDKLSQKINFLNSVENQTVLSIEDMTTAIPKAAPVVKQLGGNVEDLAYFLTAMKEGGVNASEGANALKSGLASIINPTAKASQFLQGFGINVKSIVNNDKGNLKKTVLDFATALNTLDPLNRAKAIEMMFGKFQFARISTLFKNITDQGSQASKVLGLAAQSPIQLAAVAQKELDKVQSSPMYKFQKALADIQLKIAPIGESILKIVTPIINFATKMLDGFNHMNEGFKNFIVIGAAVGGVIAPALLMVIGLVANGAANILKFFTMIKSFLNKTTTASQVLGEQTNYLTTEQLKAEAVAASLDQVHGKLKQTFTSEAQSLNLLTAAYEKSVAAQGAFSGPVIPFRGPGRKYATGGMITGPGTGTSDSIPAMLSNGEAVIPAKAVAENPGLVQSLINGSLQGFAGGYLPSMPYKSPAQLAYELAGKEKRDAVMAEREKLQKARNMQERPHALYIDMNRLAQLGPDHPIIKQIVASQFSKKILIGGAKGSWDEFRTSPAYLMMRHAGLKENRYQNVNKLEFKKLMEKYKISTWDASGMQKHYFKDAPIRRYAKGGIIGGIPHMAKGGNISKTGFQMNVPGGAELGHFSESRNMSGSDLLAYIEELKQDKKITQSKYLNVQEMVKNTKNGLTELFKVFDDKVEATSKELNITLGEVGSNRTAPRDLAERDLITRGRDARSPIISRMKDAGVPLESALLKADLITKEIESGFKKLGKKTTVTAEDIRDITERAYSAVSNVDDDVRMAYERMGQASTVTDRTGDRGAKGQRVSFLKGGYISTRDKLRRLRSNLPSGSAYGVSAFKTNPAMAESSGVSEKEIQQLFKSLPSEAKIKVHSALQNGAKAFTQALFSEVEAMGNGISTGVKQITQTASPSKKTTKIGQDIGQGYIDGGKSKIGEAKTTGASFGQAAVDAMNTKKTEFKTAIQSAYTITPAMKTFLSSESKKIFKPYIDEQGNLRKIHIASVKVLTNEEVAIKRLTDAQKINTIASENDAAAHILDASAANIGSVASPKRGVSGFLGGLKGGKAMGIGFGASMAVSAASMIPGPIGNIANSLMPIVGIASSLLPILGMLGRFAGPLGLAITAIGGIVTISNMLNDARKKEVERINSVSNAAKTTASELSKLASLTGSTIKKSPIELLKGGIQAGSTGTKSGYLFNKDVSTLVRQQKRDKDFNRVVTGLKSTSVTEGRNLLRSKYQELVGAGIDKRSAATQIAALQQASGINFGFTATNLSGKQGIKGFETSFGSNLEYFKNTRKNAIKNAKREDVSNVTIRSQETLRKEMAAARKKGFTDLKYTMDQQGTYNITGKRVSQENKAALKESLQNTANFIKGISGQFAIGEISIKQFNNRTKTIAQGFFKMKKESPVSELQTFQRTIKLINPDLATSTAGIKNVSDQMLIMKAAMAGVAETADLAAIMQAAALDPTNEAKQSAAGDAKIKLQALLNDQLKITGSLAADQNKNQTTGQSVADKLVANMQKQIDLLTKKEDSLKKVNDQLSKQKQFEDAQLQRSIDMKQAFISGDYLKASQIKQEAAYAKTQYEKEQQIQKLDDIIAKAENKLALVQNGKKGSTSTKSIKSFMSQIKAEFNSVLNSIPGKAVGGLVTGPGTGTSDSILARVSAGEYVMKASAVKNIGVSNLDRINGYANGGLVGGNGTSYGDSVYNVNMTINGAGSNANEIADQVIRKLNNLSIKNNKSNRVTV